MTVADEEAPAPVEIELKYEILDAAALEAGLAGPTLGPFAVGPELADVHTEDRFVDTAGRHLRAGGYVARLRRSGDELVVTLKSATTRSGAEHRRIEIEGPARGPGDGGAGAGGDGAGDGGDPASGVLDPRTWPDSPARDLVRELAKDRPLVELATIRQRRRPRELLAGETTVELTMDDVSVIAPDGREIDRFGVLEAELRAGDESLLGELADVLEMVPGIATARGSKMERALRATERARAEAQDTSPDPDAAPLPPPRYPGVLPDDTVAEAGRKVLRFHLERFVAREAGTRLGENPEELHKMRVATRRMRAAWRVFGSGFRPERTRRFRRMLREVAMALGAVRDRDVLIEGIEAYRGGLPPDERAGLQALVDELGDERFEARLLLLRELDSAPYRRWLDDILGFTAREGAGVLAVGPTTPHHVRDTAASAIWTAYEQVRGYEAVLRTADVATLHQLRIAAKRLRYTLEYLRETLTPEAGTLIERIVVLQDHLGEMNDADVAATVARSFLARRADALDEATVVAVGRYLTSREREVERLRRSLGGPWRGVAGAAFRETLGRVTAAL